MDTAIQINERENSKSNLMLIYSIGLGIIFDILFYDNNIGLNYPLYALFFLGGIYLFIRNDESFSLMRFMVFSIVIIYIASSFVRFSFSSVINLLNFLAIPVLFAVLPALSTKDFNTDKKLPLIALERFLMSLGGFIFIVEKTFKITATTIKAKNKSKTYGILAGLFLSLLAMAIIIPLMASADMVFNEIMIKITRNMTSGIEFERLISHLFIIFLVSGYMYGFLKTVLRKPSTPSFNVFNSNETDMKSTEEIIADPKAAFDSTIPLTIFLIVINLLFLLFSYIQVKYIILGGTDFLPENISYAEYARSGFFQMMVLSVINFSITILLSSHISKLNNTKKLQILLTTLSIFTIIVICSSYSRMNLYENTYGYTRLRFLVYIILFTEAGLNLMLMYGIWNKGFEFVRYGLLSVLLVFLMLNTVNIDGYIASRNIDRYVERDDIDMSYLLYRLSSDASSEILRLKDMDLGKWRDDMDEYYIGCLGYASRDLSFLEFNLSDKKAYENALEYFKE
jgi:hypothetical protein